MEDTNASASSIGNNLAKWFGTSVVAAFFASLERCACVNVDADGEEENEDANDEDDALMITTFYSFNSSTSSSNGTMSQSGDGTTFASTNSHA